MGALISRSPNEQLGCFEDPAVVDASTSIQCIAGIDNRVGKVRGDLRGQLWYLTYHEHVIRRQRPRVGRDLAAAQQLAAQINGQLASDAPAALSYRVDAVLAPLAPIKSAINAAYEQQTGRTETVLATIERCFSSSSKHLPLTVDR